MKVDADAPNQLIDSAFALADEVEQLAEGFLSSLRLTQGNDVELLICSIAMRCLNFFRAAICLTREHLAQPVAACVRSLIEQRWVLESVAGESSREEAIRKLAEHDEYNRKRDLNNLRTLGQSERDHRITEECLAKMAADVDSPSAQHTLGSWAKLANRESEYLTAYALLCGQTHPSLRAVEDHLSFDAEGRLHSVTTKAGVQSLSLYVIHACEIMIDVIAACPVSWHAEDMANHMAELRHRLSELWESVPDPLNSFVDSPSRTKSYCTGCIK